MRGGVIDAESGVSEPSDGGVLPRVHAVPRRYRARKRAGARAVPDRALLVRPSSAIARTAAPVPNAASCGVLLGVDGVLLDVRNTPGQAFATHAAVVLLDRLLERCGGAVALVSGRPIFDLDRIFHPLLLPCIAVHGAERRTPAGTIERVDCDRAFLVRARIELSAMLRAHRGVIVEDKGVAIAVHTRVVPSARADADAALASLAVASAGAFVVRRGQHVAELLPAAADTVSAAAAFLDDPRFAGRVPLALLDAASGGDALAVVRERRGVALGVGAGARRENGALATPAACRDWLERFARGG
jgi:trehalose 6-phosphate phosphatase